VSTLVYYNNAAYSMIRGRELNLTIIASCGSTIRLHDTVLHVVKCLIEITVMFIGQIVSNRLACDL